MRVGPASPFGGASPGNEGFLDRDAGELGEPSPTGSLPLSFARLRLAARRFAACFERRAGAHQVAITVGVVDAADGRPVLVLAQPGGRPGRLRAHYDVLFAGRSGRVAHEFIIDCRPFERSGVRVEDIAKRLMDYGFHAPTMSFPVPGTLMIEPTESESRAELDRLCDALIAIRAEIRAVEAGEFDAEDNPLVNAPHTARAVSADAWPHRYSRQQAAWPAAWLREHKYWPPVGRIDNAYGDRNLVCTCPPIEALAE